MYLSLRNVLIFIIYLFDFISIFILLTCRKATEALTHRVSNTQRFNHSTTLPTNRTIPKNRKDVCKPKKSSSLRLLAELFAFDQFGWQPCFKVIALPLTMYCYNAGVPKSGFGTSNGVEMVNTWGLK